MREAAKAGKLPQRTLEERRQAARAQGIITEAEYEHMVYTDRLKREVIKVDDFEHDLSRAPRTEDARHPRPGLMNTGVDSGGDVTGPRVAAVAASGVTRG